jgi:adenosylcobinamide-GDP ribazoletransferase
MAAPSPLADLRAALTLLTRIPAGGDARGAAAAAWAWPLAGLAVGGPAALLGWGAVEAGFAPGLAAALTLAALVVLTGALHEDGLADCADGFWGGWDRARRLEIMRDSRLGSYGALALAVTCLARWALLEAALADGAGWAVAAAAAASRAPMAWLMAALPPARADGLSRAAGRPSPRGVALAALLGAALLLPAGPLPALLAVALAGAATLGWARLARAKIGGQTGDVLGAGQVLAEIALLAALTAR